MRTLPAPTGSDRATYAGLVLVLLGLLFALFAPSLLSSCTPVEAQNRAGEGVHAGSLAGCVTESKRLDASFDARYEAYTKCADDVDKAAGRDGG